jgi:two-component system phosphate regulon sensor histidine kinase PhoR
MNPVAARIFSLGSHPATGTPLTDFLPSQAVDLMRRTLTGGESSAVEEISLERPGDGRTWVYQALASRVVGEGGHIQGVVTVLRDVTGQKELERMKSNFLSVVSHELKTPLHSIKGFVEIILMGKTGPITEIQQDFLTTVKEQTDHLQRLIEDLLAFSRLESGELRLRLSEVSPAEIVATVEQRLAPLAERNGLDLRDEVPADFPTIHADPVRLEQVFTNLIENAIKFTPSGGNITVGGEDRGEEVLFWVRDTGIGIPPEEQGRIFERFYQVDSGPNRLYRGTGLGLSICKHIVTRHGGRIWVESNVGEGSTFFFTLKKRLSDELTEALDFG